jgi:hypothetical protein
MSICNFFLIYLHYQCNIFLIFIMKTNLMNYLSLIYFFNKPLHVSGVFITHNQEVFTVYVQQLLRVICLSDWQLPS